MNKKNLFSVFFLIVFFSLSAQSVYWEEDFIPAPDNWTLEQNWSFTNNALQLYWNPSVTNYDLSAISPEIILPGNVGDLIVTQYIDAYSPVDEIMEIGLNIDGTFIELWQYELIGGNWGNQNGEDLIIPISDFGDETVKIQFRSYGNSTYNLNWWDIYNVKITALLDNDLAAMIVDGPVIAEQNQLELWKVIVKNTGINTQDSYTVKLFRDDEIELGSIQIDESLSPAAISEHNFFWTPTILENLEIYGEVFLNGDENPNNNTTEHLNVSVFPQGERQYLLWDNDNNSDYIDPESGAFFQCEDGLENALTANDVDFDLVNELPPNLKNYNVVFAELGLYCVG